MSASGPASTGELDAHEIVIDSWLLSELEKNPAVDAVERDKPGERRWFVRMNGEQKDAFTIRFHLRQRTLHYESFFCPAPEENESEFYFHVLKRNAKMYGAAFAIGEEDAVFLQGQIDRSQIVADELDRVLGSMYFWVDRFFHPALRIGFASRFPDPESH